MTMNTVAIVAACTTTASRRLRHHLRHLEHARGRHDDQRRAVEILVGRAPGDLVRRRLAKELVSDGLDAEGLPDPGWKSLCLMGLAPSASQILGLA